MRRISMLLIAMMVFTVGFTGLNAGKNEVVLTADQVAGAPDIEYAINIATNYGTQPGIVTLDSSAGDFIFRDIDRSINIFVPNLTLRSENGAVIQNCADGIYFDALPADGVTVEGLTFHCDGAGVIDVYEHQDIVIRDNIIYAASYIVRIDYGNHWQLLNNIGVGLAGWPGFWILNATHTEVRGNKITAGGDAISLYNTRKSVIAHNELHTPGSGIRVEGESLGNRIATNTMIGVQFAGVFLGPLTAYNRVLSNRVQCESGFACEAVRDLSDPSTNKIAGNRLIP